MSTSSTATDIDVDTGIPGFREPIRKDTRRTTAWAARLRTTGAFLPCRVVDISDGGAGLNVYDAPQALTIGDGVELEMLGAGMQWQRRDAHVRHITPIPQGLRVGVEFTSDTQRDSWASLGIASALDVDSLAH